MNEKISTPTSPNPAEQRHWLSKWLAAPELYSFILGMVCVVVLWLYYLYFLHECGPRYVKQFMSILFCHITAGAGMGSLKGAGCSEIPLHRNLIINCLLTGAIIFLFNTLFSLSCKKIFHVSVLEKSFKELQANASAQKKTWVKFGIPGIFAFVFFPATGTGPIIGSVIAKIIGLGFWATNLTTFSGSCATIVVFAFAGETITKMLGDAALNIIVFSLIGILLLAAGWSYFRSKFKKTNNNPPSNQA